MLASTNARVPNNNYILIVNGVRDTSVHTNLIAANSMMPISNLATNIVGLGSGGWRYYDPFPPFDVPDLGTAWRYPDYVETNAWADGSGVFRFNTAPPGPVGTSLTQTPVPISYFRLPLANYQFEPGASNFFLTHVIDDGAIFYMNGTEFWRFNMRPGPVTYQTVASNAISTATRIGPTAVTAPLRTGGNVLAVELHQATASADIDKAFGVQIDGYVLSVPVGPAIITGGPWDVTAVEGEPATFTVSQVGGISFQWQQNSANINGATDSEYTTLPVTLGMNNTPFRILVTGANGTVASTNARLHVIADTTPPELLAGYASANSVLLNFSEKLGASATVAANYRVTNSAGATFPVSGATLQDGTNVVLAFASLPPGQYFIIVNNVRDASVAGNVIATNSTVRAGFNSTVVSFADAWRYDQRAINLGTSWTALNYDDSAWSGSGPGLLDGKEGGRVASTLPLPVGTVITYPTGGPGGVYLTNTYFRAHFDSYASGTGTLTFQTVMDDGGVIYLNGVEVGRIRMPTGNISYTTTANAAVSDATVEGPFLATVTNLAIGDNVIAVEIHQNGTASTDITWGGQFSLFVPSTIPVPVPPPSACTNIALTLPALRFQRVNGTNTLLSWTNPATNTCGSNAVFTLQQTLSLSNPASASRWSNVTAVSPYTAIGTNTRFFRLKL